MFIKVTQEKDGTYSAQVGASEVRFMWPSGRIESTSSLGFTCIADTMEEAVNELAKVYFNYMFKPHTRNLDVPTRINAATPDISI